MLVQCCPRPYTMQHTSYHTYSFFLSHELPVQITPGTELEPWRTCFRDSTVQLNTGGCHEINRLSACKATDCVDAVHNRPVNRESWVTNLALCSNSTIKTLWMQPSMIQWMIWVFFFLSQKGKHGWYSGQNEKASLGFQTQGLWAIKAKHTQTNPFLFSLIKKMVLLLKHFSTLHPNLLSTHVTTADNQRHQIATISQLYNHLTSFKKTLCVLRVSEPVVIFYF